MVEADLSGPGSPTCRTLAALHDLCLTNRKDGYQLFSSPRDSSCDRHSDSDYDGHDDVIAVPIPPFPSSCPHYMAIGTGTKAKISSCTTSSALNSYHSTSVLGRLFDFMQCAVMAAGEGLRTGSMLDNNEAASVLDPDYNIDTMIASDSVIPQSAACPTDGVSRGRPPAVLPVITKHQYLQAATALVAR